MKGIDKLKTIDDYKMEIKEVERQIEITKSVYRKNELSKYLYYLKKEVNDYYKFSNSK